MNPKLILALLNQKNHNKGFTVFLATGIGLIMLVVATTMLLKGQATRTNASAQKSAATSVAIAETGMTRNLSQLNTKAYYPYLTKSQDPVPLSETTAYLGTSYSGWDSQPDQIGDLCETVYTSETIDALRTETAIDATEGTKYKLLSYIYTPYSSATLVADEDGDPNTMDDNTYKVGEAKMLIRGEKNKGGSDNLASVSDIELTADVHRRILPGSFPGLYASDTIALSGGDIISVESADSDDANIICGDCNVTATTCDEIATKDGEAKDTYILTTLMGGTSQAVVDGNVYLAGVSMPELKPPTTECNLPAITSLDQLKDCKITVTTTPLTVPRATDISALPSSIQSQLTNNNNSYYFNYVLSNNVTYAGSDIWTIDSGKGPIRLFATKDITMSGNATIRHISTNSSGTISLGASERFALIGNPYDPDDLNTDQNWTLNGGATTTNMFIYAPDAKVRFNGASGTDPDLFGALWVKNFDNNGNQLQIQIPDDYGQLLGDIYGLDFELGIRIYSTSAPKSWKRTEVN